MATRFSVERGDRLHTGYDSKNVSTDLTIPSCGLEDVDRAVFKLFDDQNQMNVGEADDLKRVPVIFAAGEKWAMIKKKKVIRDRNGVLILPLITIGRMNIVQNPSEDIAGRGINQQTGELKIKRRLSGADRGYQNWINRLLIKNQLNVAVGVDDGPIDGQISTKRDVGELKDDVDVRSGALLRPDRKNNVYEIITLPAPQFFTARYEVTFWTQYTTHMNQMIEYFIASQLPQGNAFRLETDKGYWFVASADSPEFTPEVNFDDMAKKSRVIKYKFTFKVPAYVLASDVPGAPVPVRRHVSSPTIDFSVGVAPLISTGNDGDDNPFLGADDPTLPLQDGTYRVRRDARRSGHRRLDDRSKISENDPALLAYPRGTVPQKYMKVVTQDVRGRPVTKHVKVTNVNEHTGETTLSGPIDLGSLTIVVTDD